MDDELIDPITEKVAWAFQDYMEQRHGIGMNIIDCREAARAALAAMREAMVPITQVTLVGEHGIPVSYALPKPLYSLSGERG